MNIRTVLFNWAHILIDILREITSTSERREKTIDRVVQRHLSKFFGPKVFCNVKAFTKHALVKLNDALKF